MLLGAHEAIAGGVSKAFARAEADGADCLQIFTRNARGWAAKPLEDGEVDAFRTEARRTGKPVAAHSSYLI
ncbi:MAG TPA: deoxyribonuclease IV, partial [Thermoanaerobaculia bacterium]|nr:deoxyribonuclease IV [Thermoanaerobaculia bacterium]